MLDLTSFKNAITSLERALEAMRYVEADQYTLDCILETIRAGVIQNFEMVHELSWKYIQRWINENTPARKEEFPLTRKDLFRTAAQYGLIDDPEAWFAYHNARNLTSHMYDVEKTLIVLETAPRLLADARLLLKRIEARNA